MTAMTIGKIAEQAGVNLETVRYYERKGLIKKPEKRGSGFRYYPKTVVQRIRFIKRAQELGFVLKEIKELMTLRVMPGTKCKEIQKKAESKISEIKNKINALRSMQRALERLTAT